MRLLIAVAVYNRKDVTQLALQNLMQFKSPSTKLVVYNDWSTEYDNDFLEPLCDEVIKLPASPNIEVKKNSKNINGRGIAHIRWHQFRAFVQQDDFDFIYMTDPDTLHDPSFEERLFQLYDTYDYEGEKLPVCLYNTRWHSDKERIVFENNEVMVRKTIPGISQLYSKSMCETIVRQLDSQTEDPSYGWDYRSINFLSGIGIVSKQSFVEHFGASNDSMHSKKDDWDRDRAINPTDYLHNIRQETISLLQQLEWKKYDEVLEGFYHLEKNQDAALEFFKKYNHLLEQLHGEINTMMDRIKQRVEKVGKELQLKDNTKQWLYKGRNVNRFYILVHDIKIDENVTIVIDSKLTVHGWSFEIFFREKENNIAILEKLFQNQTSYIENNRLIIQSTLSFLDEAINVRLQEYLDIIYTGYGYE